MKDLTALTPVNLIPATSASSATVTGTGKDISQYEQDGTAQVLLGSTAGGAGATLDVKLQTSADNSTNWTDITGAVFTQVGNAASVQEIGLKLRSCQKYVRAVGTIAGTATFTWYVILNGQPKYA